MADNTNLEFGNIKSLDHIADTVTPMRPGMTNTFRVKILDLEGVADKTSTVDGATLGQQTETVLMVSNEDFEEPKLSQNSVSLTRGNLVMEFPAQMTAHSSSSKFTCFVDENTYGKLYSWKCLSGDHETGEVGDPTEYWKTVIVEHINGRGALIGTWTLHNCWISDLQGVTFSNGSAEIKTCSVTLKYFKPSYRKAENN